MNWETPALPICGHGSDKPKTPRASTPPRQKPLPVGVEAAINDLQRELDRLPRMVTGLIQRLAKHEPDALGLLDDIYPVKFAPSDPGTKNSGDVNSGGIAFNLSDDDDCEDA